MIETSANEINSENGNITCNNSFFILVVNVAVLHIETHHNINSLHTVSRMTYSILGMHHNMTADKSVSTIMFKRTKFIAIDTMVVITSQLRL